MYETKFKITYIQFFFMCSLLVTFLPMGIIYSSGNYAYIMQMIYVLQFAVYSVTIYLCIKKRKNRDLFTTQIKVFIIWGVILLASTYLYSRSWTTTFKALNYILGILALFFVIKYMFKYEDKKSFSILYICFSIFSFVNILAVILYPNGLYNYGWQGATYWFGGKFTTFYMFYTWLCLYVVKKRMSNIMAYIIPIAVGLFLCVKTDCSTGIACLGLTGILIFIKKWIVKIKPWMIILILLGMAGIMILSNIIFENSIIKYLVTNVLHRTTLLTGRVEIYHNFQQIIQNYKWLGAGYGNSIVMDNTVQGYVNAQNGVLDIVTKSGLIGLVIFMTVLYVFWKEGTLYLKKMENILVAVFVIGFFICSFVEISFNYYFFILLALMGGDVSLIADKKSLINISQLRGKNIIWR